MSAGIIVGGKVFPVYNPAGMIPIQVLAWGDPAARGTVPEFKIGQGHNKARRDRITYCAAHWTGGENAPERMARVLLKRELGVEFAISRLGLIYQFCDPLEVDTADVGWLNHASVGVEIVSYGFRSLRDPLRGLVKGRDRTRYVGEVNGHKVSMADFYPVQEQAYYGLADALWQASQDPELSDRIYIPRMVAPGPRSQTEIRTLSKPEIEAFNGHIGHCEVSAKKYDPGPRFMWKLQQRFRAVSPGAVA